MSGMSLWQDKPKSLDCAWDFSGCKNLKNLRSPHLKTYFDRLILLAGLDLVGSLFHKFGDGGEGISYVAIIGESHVAIHSWPEDGLIQLTIDYCNHSQNNDEKVARLQRCFRKFFKPRETKIHEPRKRGRSSIDRKKKRSETLSLVA